MGTSRAAAIILSYLLELMPLYHALPQLLAQANWIRINEAFIPHFLDQERRLRAHDELPTITTANYDLIMDAPTENGDNNLQLADLILGIYRQTLARRNEHLPALIRDIPGLGLSHGPIAEADERGVTDWSREVSQMAATISYSLCTAPLRNWERILTPIYDLCTLENELGREPSFMTVLSLAIPFCNFLLNYNLDDIECVHTEIITLYSFKKFLILVTNVDDSDKFMLQYRRNDHDSGGTGATGPLDGHSALPPANNAGDWTPIEKLLKGKRQLQLWKRPQETSMNSSPPPSESSSTMNSSPPASGDIPSPSFDWK
jgi:hypothetical protein